MTESRTTASSIPATSPSARDQRREGKKRQIVDAAANIFFEEGYSGASMDRIVDAAGVSKRTLYNYYKSKDEIFIEVIERQLGDIYRSFEPAQLQGLPLREQLTIIGSHILQLSNAEETVSLFRNMAAESRRFPKLAHHFLEESLENVIQGLMKMLQQGQQEAGLEIDNLHEAAEHFIDLLGGAEYHRVIFGTAPPMDQAKIATRTERAIRYFFMAFQKHG